MGLRKERKTLPRRPHRRELSRYSPGGRLSRLPRPHRKADSLATARRGEERWHPTHRELRHVARQQRQRPLFCAPGIKIFRRWQTRPRSTPGLPPAQRHDAAGGREMAGTVLELRTGESCRRKPASRLRVRSVPLTTRLALRRFDVRRSMFKSSSAVWFRLRHARRLSVNLPPHPVPLPARPSRGEGEQPCNGGSVKIRPLRPSSHLAFDAGAGTSLSCGKIYELPAKARLFYRIRHDSRWECG